MKAVKIQYTVKTEYIEENKRNIRHVMNALRSQPIPGLHYSSFTDRDYPNIFIHINMAKDDATMAKLNNVSEFIKFRDALKASQPLSPPTQTTLDLVAAGFDLK